MSNFEGVGNEIDCCQFVEGKVITLENKKSLKCDGLRQFTKLQCMCEQGIYLLCEVANTCT